MSIATGSGSNRTTSTRIQSKSLALIIILLVVSIAGFWLPGAFRDALQPVKKVSEIKPIANSILSFKKLPPHYFYKSAQDSFWGAKSVSLYSNKDNQTVYILSSLKINPFASAQDIVHDAAKNGVPGLTAIKTINPAYGKMPQPQEGTLRAAGKKLFYISGEADLSLWCNMGVPLMKPTVIACTTRANRFYLLHFCQNAFSEEEQNNSLDLNKIESFLACIDEFK